MNIFIKSFFLLIAMTVVLSACGGKDVSDLQEHIAKAKKSSTVAKKQAPLKELQLPAQVKYQGSSLRSPFETSQTFSAQKNESLPPLQTFGLNMLRFVGSISENDQVTAIILTPDNKLYEVKKGERIGDHHGSIVNIYSDHLEVNEEEQDEDGKIGHHTVTMQLKE